MPVIERDVVNQSIDENGRETIDFPLARLGWIEDTAEVKNAPGERDYIPIVDGDGGGQLKKTPVHALAASSSAQAYSASAAYAVGDYCNYGGKLYRCKTAVPAGEAWNAAHWVETSLNKELSAKQDKLAGAAGQVPVFGADGTLEARDLPGAAAVSFQASEWGPPASVTAGAEYDGASGYALTVPAEKHKRKGGDFTFQIFHLLADGTYRTNTWAAMGTEVRYDEGTGSAVLESPDAYSGKILFVS